MSFDLKDPKNQKLLLVGVIFLFLVYMWYSKVYTPGQERIKARKLQYQAMLSELVKVKAQAAPLEELRREYHALSANLQPLGDLLPEKETTVDFLNLLHNAAQANNVVIREVTPVGSLAEGEFLANNFRMGLEGSYHDFGRFLAQVANFPFIVKVSQMSLKSHLQSQSKEEREKTILANFTITTYNANSKAG